MALLRAPGGCPWDREQTHQSIRSNLLEETHEALEAIDRQDDHALCEELGDILLQVVFHAQMAGETGSFTFEDVTNGICQKLVLRHPHVFGDVEVSSSTEVLKNWDAIKRRSKGEVSRTGALQNVPRSLPALMRAEKVQGRAGRAGFDWQDMTGPLQALLSETDELKDAIRSGNQRNIEEELGDLIFSCVNVARFVKVDPEKSLSDATDKFIRRFEMVEQLAEKRRLKMEEMPLSELDKLWEEAKAQLQK